MHKSDNLDDNASLSTVYLLGKMVESQNLQNQQTSFRTFIRIRNSRTERTEELIETRNCGMDMSAIIQNYQIVWCLENLASSNSPQLLIPFKLNCKQCKFAKQEGFYTTIKAKSQLPKAKKNLKDRGENLANFLDCTNLD